MAVASEAGARGRPLCPGSSDLAHFSLLRKPTHGTLQNPIFFDFMEKGNLQSNRSCPVSLFRWQRHVFWQGCWSSSSAGAQTISASNLIAPGFTDDSDLVVVEVRLTAMYGREE